jgi:hypothetical protein
MKKRRKQQSQEKNKRLTTSALDFTRATFAVHNNATAVGLGAPLVVLVAFNEGLQDPGAVLLQQLFIRDILQELIEREAETKAGMSQRKTREGERRRKRCVLRYHVIGDDPFALAAFLDVVLTVLHLADVARALLRKRTRNSQGKKTVREQKRRR